MSELTIHDLDAEFAEQLPVRELMGRTCWRSSSPQPYHSGQSYNTTIVQGNGGNYDGNGNGNTGFGGIGILNGNLDGNFNGDSVNVA